MARADHNDTCAAIDGTIVVELAYLRASRSSTRRVDARARRAREPRGDPDAAEDDGARRQRCSRRSTSSCARSSTTRPDRCGRCSRTIFHGRSDPSSVSAAARRELLDRASYYPRETWTAHGGDLTLFVAHAVTIIRELARRYTIEYVERIIPDPLDPVLRELIFATELARTPAFTAALVDAVRAARSSRSSSCGCSRGSFATSRSASSIVAGDLGDRGPRLDKVIELLEQQPNVEVTWGNHDADWLAATLGQPAAVATVVRLSLRYQRLAQLEEGFGISLAPLAQLAREAYGDDPCGAVQGQGRCRCERDALRADAEGDRDDPVQARGRAVQAPPRVAARASRRAASRSIRRPARSRCTARPIRCSTRSCRRSTGPIRTR